MNRLAKGMLVAIALSLAATLSPAQSLEVEKPDPVVEARLKDLAEELRCLVCQNQTIADSNAPLALDLRNQIRTQVAQGRSDDQIREYMTQRYGDFVLYKPPMRATTVLLWVGPFALLAAGLVFFVLRVRRRPAGVVPEEAATPAPVRPDIAALLEGDEPATQARPEAAPEKKKGGRKGRP